jgi:N-acetylglucosamine-6-phosphate deacetylase
MVQTIFAEKVFTGETVLRDQLITCDKGMVISVVHAENSTPALKVKYLSAGFNDIHINGGDRLNFTKTADGEGVENIASSCAVLGTAYTLPTIISSPLETIFKGIEAIKKFREEHPYEGVLGMHLEGPFLHPLKRGAHVRTFLQKPSDSVLDS